MHRPISATQYCKGFVGQAIGNLRRSRGQERLKNMGTMHENNSGCHAKARNGRCVIRSIKTPFDLIFPEC